jgi:hypothetical protein
MQISRRLIGGIVLAAALAFPLGVMASHGFTDVPDSNTFHADIDAIADAGVTTGCGPSIYCPEDFVTREQMAAFLNRLGALGPGKTPVVNADKLDGEDSTAFARTDVERTGQSTCASYDFAPTSSAVAYSQATNQIFSTADNLNLRCQFHLPDGAELTGFKLAVRDNSATEYIGCRLDRTPHLGTGVVAMGTIGTSQAGTPGDVVLSSDDGFPEVVDNAAYTYGAFCSFIGFGSDITLFSASVEYTLAGVPLE